MKDKSAGVSGLPGLLGTEHIGFTVPDLDEATQFFVDVIGCEMIYPLGPFSAEDDWMETHLNVHPRTVMQQLRFFRCKHGPNFEIFQYSAPDQKTQQPRNSDIGGHHLAFYVEDLDAAQSPTSSSKAYGFWVSQQQAGTRAPVSAGCTFYRHGGCNSNW